MRTGIVAIIICVLAASCHQKNKQEVDPSLLSDQKLIHNNLNQLTEVVILDMYSPPVASRIYSYCLLAAYEAIRFNSARYPSIANELNKFPKMPLPDSSKKYNYLLAATKAFITVAEKITFSKDTLVNYGNQVYEDFKSLLDEESYNNSISFGEAVGVAVLERTKVDNYKETRGMPKFLGSNDIGKWRPTASDYLDALEPNWGMILPLSLDSAAQIKCPLPPTYSMDKKSVFYKNVNEVYKVSLQLDDERKTIAKYWDDNPFVIEHSGHLMFGNKKITPVGHWLGITAIASKIKKLDAVEAAKIYALTSVAMYDVGITCWREKYLHNVIRPITVINESFDRNWQTFLQTPPFPEHSSGHSGFSAAAATVLTHRFGDNFAFEDTSDLAYIGMKRSFSSFNSAAQEASISRIYGGIHYRSGIDAGAVQGRAVGNHIIQKFMSDTPFSPQPGLTN